MRIPTPAVPGKLAYQLVGTPSGHLWQTDQQSGQAGDVREMECYYCHVKVHERYVEGACTNWWELLTWCVPHCTNSFNEARHDA